MANPFDNVEFAPQDAYIENNMTTTIGVHRNCPNWRRPAHMFVCECTTPEIQSIRRSGPFGFTSPAILPEVIS